MSEYNFGIIKTTFTNYLNESEDVVARDSFKKFMQLIKESELLKGEFKFYKNLEEKYQPNDVLAAKYIDDTIKQFTNQGLATFKNLSEEHSKFKVLVEGLKTKVSPAKKELYEQIHTLLFESLRPKMDVDQLNEAYSFVMEYIKNNKPKLVESTEDSYENIPKDFLIRKAIEKFNDKFASLNEDDKVLFKTIISEDVDIRSNYFKTLKNGILSTLSEYDKVDDSINEAVDKLNKMNFNETTYIQDVLTLKELNEDLS